MALLEMFKSPTGWAQMMDLGDVRPKSRRPLRRELDSPGQRGG